MAAAVDDLDVVDADDRQAVAPREQPREALEVADHRRRARTPRRCGSTRARSAASPRPRPAGCARASASAHLVLAVGHREAPDLAAPRRRGALGQVGARAPRGDDPHVVALAQVLDHHARPGRVAHPLADHAVQDPHPRRNLPLRPAPPYQGRTSPFACQKVPVVSSVERVDAREQLRARPRRDRRCRAARSCRCARSRDAGSRPRCPAPRGRARATRRPRSAPPSTCGSRSSRPSRCRRSSPCGW